MLELTFPYVVHTLNAREIWIVRQDIVISQFRNTLNIHSWKNFVGRTPVNHCMQINPSDSATKFLSNCALPAAQA
mgnify:CR=1 FL=1